MTDETALGKLLSLWEHEQAQGRDVPALDLCRDQPELAPELERRILAIQQMNQLARIKTVAFSSGKSAPHTERFVPGALLANRYRIVALLGKGGMGEVYRADDLTLGQPVALKFLPAHLGQDADRLTRFRKEVALARKVSHPNACRVYDIAEHEGQPFLTMEYIDGEDLASVLRRFGRLPEERAVEAARQLCSALAAVHEQGLLHRDLKPQNVMLDGRGRVRLADFGLAALTGEVVDVGSGTPLYMAPEQLAGKEVSVQSDLFALGLVLYELFTGKRAFAANNREELARKYAAETPSKPSSYVGGMNPAVESAVLRCLEREPKDRPRSAYEVLAALPGGDPLAMALAAGETPSPQMVADAGTEGRIRPWVGMVLYGAVLVGLCLLAALADHTMLFRRVPLTEPPEVLAREAQQLLTNLGYPEKPADVAYHYRVDGDYLKHTLRNDPSPSRWDSLGTGRPAALYFFYRQSTAPLVPILVPTSGALIPDPSNPPPNMPGMAGVNLDAKGRLLYLYAIPRRHETDEAAPVPENWHQPLFEAAKLEPVRFHAVPPEWSPPGPCDERRAWMGTFAERPDVEMRVEAAVYRGKPVYFEIIGPWTKVPSEEMGARSTLWIVMYLGILAATALLAVRNLRLGRSDLRGAARLGLFLLGFMFVAWLVGGHHSLSVVGESCQAIIVVGTAVYTAVTLVQIYLAMEPALRRSWPWRIIAWNRLLDGRFRDPLVGRDLLIGAMCAVGSLVIAQVGRLAFGWLGLPPLPPQTGCGPNWANDLGPPTPFYALLFNMFIAIYVPIYMMTLAFLCFLILRREWLSWTACGAFMLMLLFLSFWGPTLAANVLTLVILGLLAGMFVFVMRRFGLLAYGSYVLCSQLLELSPLTTDISAWYFGRGLAAALAVAVLAGYGCWTATVGQRWFKEGFFADG